MGECVPWLRHIDHIASVSAALSAGYFLTAAPLISGFMLNLVRLLQEENGLPELFLDLFMKCL